MNPKKVVRSKVRELTDLPNVGPATAGDLVLLGISHPADLIRRDAMQMYEELCTITQCRHDPCVIDVFLSLTDFMAGNRPRPWWEYTARRKKLLNKASRRSNRL